MNVWGGLIQNRLQAVKAPALQLHCFCMGDRQTQTGAAEVQRWHVRETALQASCN